MAFSEKYKNIWNTSDEELANKIFDKNVAYTFNLTKIHGKEAVITHILETESTYKVHYDIFDICSTLELEYHQWQARAVLRKEFENFAPTNKEFHYHGLTLLKVKNSLITEVIVYSDIDEVLEKNRHCPKC